MFPYLGNNHPNWLSCFFRGVRSTSNQKQVVLRIPRSWFKVFTSLYNYYRSLYIAVYIYIYIIYILYIYIFTKYIFFFHNFFASQMFCNETRRPAPDPVLEATPMATPSCLAWSQGVSGKGWAVEAGEFLEAYPLIASKPMKENDRKIIGKPWENDETLEKS